MNNPILFGRSCDYYVRSGPDYTAYFRTSSRALATWSAGYIELYAYTGVAPITDGHPTDKFDTLAFLLLLE